MINFDQQPVLFSLKFASIARHYARQLVKVTYNLTVLVVEFEAVCIDDVALEIHG